MDILQMVKDAQGKLRATQINWQEECLFDCDDILTGVIRELENAQQSAHLTPEIQATPQTVINAEALESSGSVPQSAQAQVA